MTAHTVIETKPTRATAISILANITSDTAALFEMITPQEKLPAGRVQPGQSAQDVNFVMAEMFDSNNEILLRYPLYITRFCHKPSSISATPQIVHSIAGTVPLPHSAVRMVLRTQDNVLAVKEIPATGPNVILEWKPADHSLSGMQEIKWKAIHPEGYKMQHHVCMINADQSEWRGLTLPQDVNATLVDFNQLPGGKTAIGIVSTDGFNITKTVSDFFILPLKPCIGTIILPDSNGVYQSRQPILLSGKGYYAEDMRIEKNFLHWENSKGEALGCGRSIEVFLPEGRHEIKLIAGSKGREGSVSRTITVQ
jgi:hypothetical protein